jgi:thioredoxin reductase (NADPH)
MEIVDIVIIGGGPAGLAAATYASRARAKTVVLEYGIPGGQIVTTDWVENYPGLVDGCSGAELGEHLKNQAEKFGADIRQFVTVTRIEPVGEDFVVHLLDGEPIGTKSVILATGAVPRHIGVPGEAEFTGRGVSWCAVCDGALYRDKTVSVIGGGDAAVEEALFLTKFAAKVHLIHRRDELRATKCIQERCFANEKIEIHWDRTVKEIEGAEHRVAGLRLKSTKDDTEEFLPVDGVFIYVGIEPKVDLVRDLVELDERGFIKVGLDNMSTWPGLYAAGDVTNDTLKQVVTAAAQGATAAFHATSFIEERVCMLTP